MNIKILLNNSQGYQWYTSNGVSTKGYAWIGENYLTGIEFSEYIGAAENLTEIVNKLNGCYACVIAGEKNTTAFVDRTRSFPLFYAREKDYFIMADDANLLRSKLPESTKDKKSIKEFTQTGYVTGNNTLITEIKQLQAGELIEFDSSQQTASLSRYFEFRHGDYLSDNEAQLFEELDQCYLSVFERLINSLSGKTAVIPLSGGYDSRLIAVMLKRLGYEKVICFTYGVPGNAESEISRKTADALGYEWIFVPYKKGDWNSWYLSDEYKKYERKAANYVSLAHLQDWPAVRYLKNNSMIPEDSIFIPGHTGDFVAGGHIPTNIYNVNEVSKLKLMSIIFEKHYSLFKKDSSELFQLFADRLSNTLHLKDIFTKKEAADEFEKWDWQERQAKFIVNSVRVYEYFGYQWRLPIWDKSVLDIWSRIELNDRFSRNLYKKYDRHMAGKISNINLPVLETPENQSKTFKAIKKIKKRILKDDNLGVSNSKSNYILRRLKMKILGQESINSILVKNYIKSNLTN